MWGAKRAGDQLTLEQRAAQAAIWSMWITLGGVLLAFLGVCATVLVAIPSVQQWLQANVPAAGTAVMDWAGIRWSLPWPVVIGLAIACIFGGLLIGRRIALTWMSDALAAMTLGNEQGNPVEPPKLHAFNDLDDMERRVVVRLASGNQYIAEGRLATLLDRPVVLVSAALHRLAGHGLIDRTGDHVRLSPAGVAYVDTYQADIFSERNWVFEDNDPERI
jgi:hypothetical protein